MNERVRTVNDSNKPTKMGPDIGPKKTMIVAVIVVGCFAVLWPKVFHPMFFGTPEDYLKPSAVDKTTGCCDVFSEKDMNTIKILSELCGDIIKTETGKPPTTKDIYVQCRTEVLRTCGIDISSLLQEKFRFGHTVKQILNEIRSLNGSLCLKYNFGVAPWRLGVPHRIVTKLNIDSVRQERPPHMRPEMMHPAFRERGSAIPRTQGAPKAAATPPRIVEGRPGPIPGMRPPMGGAGHVVPPSQKGSSMGIIMPIYTIGIVIFFTYTLMKLLFKKQPDGVGGALYPPVDSDRSFRRDVFESERSQLAPRLSRDVSSKIVVNAMSALLDEVDEELEARRKANQNGHVKSKKAEAESKVVEEVEVEQQPSVKIVGMETTASCEDGQKWTKPNVPIVPLRPPTPTIELKEPPQEIFLEGSLPAQSQILVSDAKIETNRAESDNDDDPAIVLAGKMTLSVISLIEDIKDEEMNGEDDLRTESKYTTASSATAAEPEVSDDDENQEELLEDIEVNPAKSPSESEE